MFKRNKHLPISAQSRSFIILFSIALLGSYTCLFIAAHANIRTTQTVFSQGQNSYQTITYEKSANKKINSIRTAIISDTPEQAETPVDTSAWKTYIDPTKTFSFLYPSEWQVKKPGTKYGIPVITVDPGVKYDNVTIYMSPSSFFAMDGLPSTTETIAGEQAKNVEGSVYGILHLGTYYTFDKGMSVRITPQFKALVHSLRFIQ